MFAFADSPEFRSLSKVRTRRFAAILAVLICLCLGLGAWALVAVPWWQSVPGSGKVIVYSPMERAQTVEAQISGRLERWYVSEGQAVVKGQRLARLSDLDSKFLDPLQLQRTREMVAAYESKREFTRLRLSTLDSQARALRGARGAALPAANQRVAQSRQRRKQADTQRELSRQNVRTDRMQYDRLKLLEGKGLRSRRDYELAEQALVRSQTELERSELGVNLAQRDIAVAELEVERLEAGFENDLARVEENWLKTQESLAEVEAELAKLRIEASAVQQRRLQRWVVAPRAGRVVRMLVVGEAQTVKAGDALCTVMPEVKDPAVEMYISDFDAPLVHQGQRVRLMFDGFPAIPFTAFPWAAVGTFAGKVQVVDANSEVPGKYRVLVVPDPLSDDLPWPDASEDRATYPMRPGTQAQGWIMMDRPVPLYWELWRRLNAFPPVPLGDDKSLKPVLKR